MKLINQSKKGSTLILMMLLFMLSALSAHAQNIFDAANPVGKYVVTDVQNRKITLNIGKSTGTDILDCARGRGTITVGGRTLNGNWNITKMNGTNFLCFETYDNIRFSYSLPSGSVKTDQIIISEDGTASYNISQLLDRYEQDWVKARKVTAAKKKKKKKKTRK